MPVMCSKPMKVIRFPQRPAIFTRITKNETKKNGKERKEKEEEKRRGKKIGDPTSISFLTI